MFLCYLADLCAQLSPKMFWHIQGNGEMGTLKDNDMSSGEFVAVLRQSEDYVMSTTTKRSFCLPSWVQGCNRRPTSQPSHS
ncbi:unnamed protein product [Musa acuminata subsp. burmannicoides]